MTTDLLKLNKLFKEAFLIHLICWIIFISYELLMVYMILGKLETPYVYVAYYVVNISFFYSLLTILNFTFTGSDIRYIKGLLFYILLTGLYLIIKSLTDYLLHNQSFYINNIYIYTKGFLQRNFFRSLYFTSLAIFYWSAGHISHFRRKTQEAEKLHLIAQKEKAELEMQLAKLRNAYLQQQIKPHILFNTLNFIYSSTQKYSDDAAHCIWLLAEIMRFSLEEPDAKGKIRLDLEIEQIENMLNLNRYRFENQLYISVEMKGDFSKFQIIPLILLTLTENMFKHGNLTDANQPGRLSLTVDETGNLMFSSHNLRKSKNSYPSRRQSLGLENIQIRLDNTYAGKYVLDIIQTDDFYKLTLQINL